LEGIISYSFSNHLKCGGIAGPIDRLEGGLDTDGTGESGGVLAGAATTFGLLRFPLDSSACAVLVGAVLVLVDVLAGCFLLRFKVNASVLLAVATQLHGEGAQSQLPQPLAVVEGGDLVDIVLVLVVVAVLSLFVLDCALEEVVVAVAVAVGDAAVALAVPLLLLLPLPLR
jgi:hypothetical protein